jgi:hypothetical protein
VDTQNRHLADEINRVLESDKWVFAPGRDHAFVPNTDNLQRSDTQAPQALRLSCQRMACQAEPKRAVERHLS